MRYSTLLLTHLPIKAVCLIKLLMTCTIYSICLKRKRINDTDYIVELMKDFDKARLESMSNRIEELEAHIEILENQLELYYAE